jgi:hypothetical protein
VEIKKEDHGEYMRHCACNIVICVIHLDIDGHKQLKMLGKQQSPAEYRYPPLKTATEDISRSSLGVLESDMTEEDLIITKMASNHRQAKVDLAKLVS